MMDNFNTVRRDGLTLAPHHDMPLELFERVDVLKGPSGFLYGFNSPGGSVNYLTKRPTLALHERESARLQSAGPLCRYRHQRFSVRRGVRLPAQCWLREER
ncbi:hypothetical protein DYL61_04255 [Pseudomonas nabeulensis]|uniref:TonB-dependent receptor plug domain-containing protein n=1 Tax=Pseudomonas nabeulensis TaxID=2293833 RepID=A0A4Z0B7Y2_9PSED|nr:hypothetical protein DYL61_04255 [Pseudomonas nabeulensis]